MAPTTIQMWSAVANAIVDWTVARRKGNDEGGNPWEALVLERLGEDGAVVEELRFSPNLPLEDGQKDEHGWPLDSLAKYVKEVNRRHTHNRNAPEVD